MQLFDLVEAVDQFLADTQTLPDLTLELTPVPKRFAQARQPMTQQVVPAAVGVTSLTLAAIALFWVPIPQVQRPSQLTPQPQSSATPTPNQPTATGTATPANVPAITDPEQMATLGQQLQTKLQAAWKPAADLQEDLTYQVSVNPKGEIVGYKPISAAALAQTQPYPPPQSRHPASNRGGLLPRRRSPNFRWCFTPQRE